jgi:hypothetical protein
VHCLAIRHVERLTEKGGEASTGSCVDWFNHRRLLDSIGHVSPAEFEDSNILSSG